MTGTRYATLTIVLTFFFSSACNFTPPPAPPLAVAFVGPYNLKIRKDIPLQSGTVATLRHGERVEIVQRRRRFLKVRSAQHQEGWTDERQLLAQADLDSLNELARESRGLLAQGQATTNLELYIHTQPWRLSPGFAVLRKGEKVDVLLHRTMPRTEPTRPPLIPPAPKRTATRKRTTPPQYPPPPMPPPPQPPANWLELSKTDPLPDEVVRDDERENPPPPIPFDLWTLVRTPGGAAGWVLTRRLVMAIPDEVAQYSEGKRIVSYFALGEVADGDVKKTHWVWTTITSGSHPYDFDAFRVFIWNLRRHRYETAYQEKRIEGYAPVLLETVPYGERGLTFPGFSICAEEDHGRQRRAYAFIMPNVRPAGERQCGAPPPATQKAPVVAPLPMASETPAAAPAGFGQRLRNRLRGWFKR